jgi:hypothetical protein
MTSNVDRFEKDLAALLVLGKELEKAMILDCHPKEMKKQYEEAYGDKTKAQEAIDALPKFNTKYEHWYSESKALLKQLLPDRVEDFTQHYEPARNRKDLTYSTYRIRDYLHGIRATQGGSVVVDKSAAITHFQQQLAIVSAAQARFKSSLFDIRQMLQADLMDSEIEAAEHLAKYKFARAAGAIAGVVLERHLSQVCKDRSLSTGKKNPTISDFNELLKSNSIIDVPQWRFIQHLADIRNLCDHSKIPEPTAEQVSDLIAGVKKIMKTVY